jgi:uncharacterized RDD family membrane protein YckC
MSQPETVSPSRGKAATANRRIVARWIDLVIVGNTGAFVLLYLWTRFVSPYPARWMGDESVDKFVSLAIGFVCLMLFDAACTKMWGRTFGKMALGLRVVAADGSPMTWRRAWSRAASVWLRGEALGIPLLFLVASAVAMRRVAKGSQASWDTIAETRVERDSVKGLVGGPLGAVVGLLLAVLVWVGVLSLQLHSRRPNSTDLARAISEQVNTQVPHRIDAATVLQTTFAAGDTLNYEYLVLGGEFADSMATSAQYVERVRALVARGDCTTPDVRDSVLALGVALQYRYADSTNKHLASFNVTYADCTSALTRRGFLGARR